MEQGRQHRVLGPGHQQGELSLSGPAAGAAYEQVAYPGYVYARTHPARLEVIGRLFGLAPPAARTARILEVGCGDGANALAIAQTLPEAQVTGLDAAAGPLERARAQAAAAGLDNLELRAANLLDEAQMRSLGPADYVIAHGVYSWIPPAARGALLQLCRDRLSAHGVAFISFNAYPGSYLRDMARDILGFHLRDVAGAAAQIAAAQELMRAIVSVQSPSPFARVLREHLQRMLGHGEALLFHDDLAEISTPFYFHEFVEHAAAHGLQFLSEAELSDSQLRDVPAAVGELIASLPDDVVVREQYLDFFTNRMFRQSLLVHAERTVVRQIDDALLEAMAISCRARPEDGAFVTDNGTSLSTSHPLAHAVLTELCEQWPEALSFRELLGRAQRRAGAGTPEAIAVVRDLLLQGHIVGAVRLHGCPLPAVRSRSHPRSSPLARAQAAGGGAVIATLLPDNHRLEDDAERDLLLAADGSRDHAALARALHRDESEVAAGVRRLADAGLLIG